MYSMKYHCIFIDVLLYILLYDDASDDYLSPNPKEPIETWQHYVL